MKKRLNTIFFGICFLVAFILEIYFIQVLKGDLFSTVGLGCVLLITGYLLMDSIREQLKENKDKAKFYIDQIIGNESEKWSERYTELMNIEKASYTAVKKSTALMQQQYEELLVRLDTLGEDREKAYQKTSGLLMKSLEGQKNALNMEINHGRENTKRLLLSLQEKDQNEEILNRLNAIITLLENRSAPEQNRNDEEEPEESEAESASFKEYNKPNVIPLYDDPNKSLTADEIANLFASYGR